MLVALIELTTAAVTLAIVHPEIMLYARPWALWRAHRTALALGRTYGNAGMRAEVAGRRHQAHTAYRLASRLTALSITAERLYRR